MSSPWICSRCSEPVSRDGYVLIKDAEHGGYPRRATSTEVTLTPAAIEKRRASGRPLDDGMYSLGELDLQNDQIAFDVLHRRCDPSPDGSEYWIGIEDLTTLEAWCWLIHHVAEKRWMGTVDIRNMIEFWFKNRGLPVPF